MKRILTILLIIAVVSIASIFVYWAFFSKHIPAPISSTSNPFSSTNLGSSNATSTPSGSGAVLRSVDGSSLQIANFIPADQPSWASTDAGYEIAGSQTDEYQIIYFPNDQSLLISLLEEPLGEARFNAEKALKSKLQFSNEQLCNLKYQISTSASVNETYGGENLGFSFCPGAVKLPR